MSEARVLKENACPLLRKELSAPEGDEAAAGRGRAYLERFARMNNRIDRELAFRKRLQDLAARSAAGAPEGGAESAGDSAARRIAELDRVINRDIDHLYALKEEIWHVLARLEDVEAANMLDDRFLSGLSSPRIAARCHCHVRTVERKIHRGLIAVDRVLREDRPMCGYVSPLASLLCEKKSGESSPDTWKG